MDPRVDVDAHIYIYTYYIYIYIFLFIYLFIYLVLDTTLLRIVVGLRGHIIYICRYKHHGNLRNGYPKWWLLQGISLKYAVSLGICISCLAGPPHKVYLGVKTRTPATNAKNLQNPQEIWWSQEKRKKHALPRKWIHFTQDPQQILCRAKIVLERSGKALTIAATIFKG